MSGRPWLYVDLTQRSQSAPEAPRTLTSRLYLGFVALTAGLAVAQFYFLPLNLGPTQFALAALGLSVVQGAQQFGDLGAHNASLRATLSRDDRARLRESALLLSTTVCGGGVLLGLILGATGMPFGYLAAVACVTAWLLFPSKVNSSGAVQMGDERAATRYNLVWQNAPKLGSVLGSFGGTALWAMIGALANAVIFYRPAFPHRGAVHALRAQAHWILPGLALSVSAFLMMWIDTYALSAVSGLSDAGQYQAVVRPLTGITYLYLPVIALIQAAHNGGRVARERRLMVVGALMGSGGSMSIALVLVLFGSNIWPEYTFDLEVVLPCGLAATLACVSAVVGGQLTLRGRQGWSALNTVLGAIALLVLSLLLIPGLGAVGAGVSSALAWAVVVLCHSVALLWTRRSPKS